MATAKPSRNWEEDPDLLERIVRSVPRILAARNAQLLHPLPAQDLGDVMQNSLVVVWRKLHLFEGRSTLATWLYRICALELMNAVRQRQRRRRLGAESLDETAPEIGSTHPDIPPSSTSEDLAQAFSLLSPEDENIVRLKHYDEQTFEDIARRLEITTSKAKSRYYRALRRLKRALQRSWTPPPKRSDPH